MSLLSFQTQRNLDCNFNLEYCDISLMNFLQDQEHSSNFASQSILINPCLVAMVGTLAQAFHKPQLSFPTKDIRINQQNL
jgi:hypothetical protein